MKSPSEASPAAYELLRYALFLIGTDMGFLTNYLNNRELAILLWLFIVSIYFLSKNKIRKSFLSAIRSLLQKNVFILLLVMILYVSGIIYGFKSLNVWDFNLLVDTIIWFFGVAFVIFMNVNDAGKDNFFKNQVINQIKLIVFLQFLINYFVFSFWIELFFVPLITLLSATLGVASVYSEYEQVEKFLNTLLGIIGLFLIGYTVYRLITDYQTLFTIQNLIKFLLPIVLTIFIIPLIFLYALYITYETLFVRMDFIINDHKVRLYAKRKTFFSYLLNLWGLKKWASKIHISSPQTKKDVDKAISKSKGSA